MQCDDKKVSFVRFSFDDNFKRITLIYHLIYHLYNIYFFFFHNLKVYIYKKKIT